MFLWTEFRKLTLRGFFGIPHYMHTHEYICTRTSLKSVVNGTMSIIGFLCFLCMVSKCIQAYRWWYHVSKLCELSDVFIQASAMMQLQLAPHMSTEHSHYAELSNCCTRLISFITAAVMTSVCVLQTHDTDRKVFCEKAEVDCFRQSE